ncbi:PEP-CTERM sorting domain-containing protein [Sabulicella rubraurantiaca]|uniref:PEP-CTERM sorting domain-containing protein n=1 Tax=Sabulicella rubraurantiaca TaxID=2811429 RepID=UPI001A96E0A2|nr:PEP-CTERM sorting domain-containing protein [Sabulicella rubraurantiaca]
MRKLALLATTAAFVGLGAMAQAAPVTIITFAQNSTTNTITANSIAGTSTTLTGTDVAITVSGYADSTPTPFQAFLNLNATSTGSATLVAGTDVFQAFSGSFSITSGAGGTGTNYLSGSFADIALAGSRVAGPQGGFQASLVASQPPGSVNFTSDQIPASKLQDPSALGFTFTALSQALDICGSTICHFTASVSGDASASQVAVPAPAGLAFLGIGLLGLAAVRRMVAA